MFVILSFKLDDDNKDKIRKFTYGKTIWNNNKFRGFTGWNSS